MSDETSEKDVAYECIESIIRTVHEPVIVLDPDLKVFAASPTFYKAFKVNPKETVGQCIYDLGNKQWDIPRLRELLKTILPQKTTFDNYEVEHDFAGIGRREMLLNARQIHGIQGKEQFILLAIEDITERKKTEAALKDAEEEYREFFKNSHDALMVLAPPLWQFTAGNPAALALFGVKSEQEFTACTPEDLSPGRQPDGRASAEKAGEMINTAMREGSHFFEWTHKRLNCGNFPSTVLLTRIEVSGRRFLQATVKDITKRRQAEELLNESAARYRALFENAPDGIFIADAETEKILDANRMAETITGRTREELIGMDRVLLHPQEQAEYYKQHFRQHVLNGGAASSAAVIEKKDGKLIPVEINAAVIQIGEKKVIQGIFEDITERRQMEDDLRFSEQKFRDLTETIPDLIWETDENNTYSYISPKIEELLGYKPHEIIGKSLLYFLFGDDAAKATEDFMLCLLRQTPFYNIEHVAINRDGRRMVLESSGNPFLDPAGRYKGYKGITRNVTERKRLEGEVNLKAILLDSVSDAILLHAPDGRIVYANKAAYIQFGYDEKEMLNMMYQQLLTSKSREKIDERMLAAIEGGETPIFDMEHVRKDGSIMFMETCAHNLELEGDQFILRVVRDITARKQAEDALKETAEIKSKFASMVSHELRSPLTAITLGVDLVLEAAGGLSAENKSLLELVHDNTGRLGRLINNVLDFQKMASGKMTFDSSENDINDLVLTTARSMGLLAKKKGLELITDISPGLPRVMLDKDKIIQVLTNLLANAIAHTEKGIITVNTGNESGTLHVAVRDTGPGIKAEDLAKLFTPFEQLDSGNSRKTGGTGLGLAISKEIILAHNGKIWVESEPGKGSVFHFTLPVKRGGA